MKSRYELMGAFARIEKNPSSRDKIVSSWKEAKIVLEEELSFPSTIVPSEVNNSDQDFASLQKQPLSSTAEKHANMLESDLKNVQEGFSALWLSSTKWKQIKSYPDQKRLLETAKKGDTTEDAEDLVTSIERESIEKADLYFNARIPNAEALYKHVQRRDDRITELEERMKAKEAEERASSLMQTLNDDDRQIVEDAIHGHGGDDQIIAQVGADSVRRASMRTLKPGMWLNDEIIHYFYLMLAKRDEGLWKNDPSLKRSHFFKSFFITKLLNEGSAICDGNNIYEEETNRNFR
ncbi:unnamed protein product [Pseudo-nitzschia multistriata]|uniref:Uncharacterized protein n=1 Tax=Pseudo-nitzschia multistriata TaxID=183589 RepID=A0A448ZLU5_9STRA|nr:unnamed protein product [Pseudo-nitzschia multistriata]